MRRLTILAGVVLLLAGGTVAWALPLDPAKRAYEFPLEPFRTLEFTGKLQGGKRVLVIALGTGESTLGLYVFDAHGNCVASDDDVGPRSRDDLAVEVFPPHTALHSIQVKNLGRGPNTVLMTLRQD